MESGEKNLEERKNLYIDELEQELAKLRSELEEARRLEEAYILKVNEIYVEDQVKMKKLQADLDVAVEALKEIQEGKGAYSMDHLQHASNCIEEMKELAKQALEKLKGVVSNDIQKKT